MFNFDHGRDDGKDKKPAFLKNRYTIEIDEELHQILTKLFESFSPAPTEEEKRTIIKTLVIYGLDTIRRLYPSEQDATGEFLRKMPINLMQKA